MVVPLKKGNEIDTDTGKHSISMRNTYIEIRYVYQEDSIDCPLIVFSVRDYQRLLRLFTAHPKSTPNANNAHTFIHINRVYGK